MAVGIAGAAACLVLAGLALMTDPGRPAPSGTAVGPASGPGALSAPANRDAAAHTAVSPDPLVIGTTIAVYRGKRSAIPGGVEIGMPGDVGIVWSYRCRAGRHCRFMFKDSGGTHNAREIDTSGPSGHGILWDTGDAGYHSFAVVANCRWSIQVVLPWPGRASQLAARDFGRPWRAGGQ
jgi:hypothetical protein